MSIKNATTNSADDRIDNPTDAPPGRPLPDGAPPLTISLDPRPGGALVMRIVGELDMDSADLLREAFDRVLRHGFLNVAIDLSQLTFCDSCGIRTLLFACVHAERLGRRMYVVNPRPFVRRMFELTGVAELLGLHASAA